MIKDVVSAKGLRNLLEFDIRSRLSVAAHVPFFGLSERVFQMIDDKC
jgi:hypothetical protein